MRWSEKETYQFVKLYLKQECLWNHKHEDYKTKIFRQKAYKILIGELKATTGISLNETELRIKIKNLRSTYLLEIDKIRKRSTIDKQYKPAMKWFTLWHDSLRCISDKFNDMHEEPYICEIQPFQEDEQKPVWLSDEMDHLNNGNNTVSQSDDFNFILKTEPDQTLDESSRILFKKKKKLKYHSLTDIEIDLENIREDEFEIYGQYIASQLRQMELRRALTLQLEIQSLLSEARMSEN